MAEKSMEALVRKPEGTRLLRRPCCRWQDNIKIYVHEIDRVGVHWINMSQNLNKWRAVTNIVMTRPGA
jgi:hypothetical protein